MRTISSFIECTEQHQNAERLFFKYLFRFPKIQVILFPSQDLPTPATTTYMIQINRKNLFNNNWCYLILMSVREPTKYVEYVWLVREFIRLAIDAMWIYRWALSIWIYASLIVNASSHIFFFSSSSCCYLMSMQIFRMLPITFIQIQSL